jgi:phage terminase large subunit-like protein
VAFFNAPRWVASADKTLKEEDYRDDPCYIGVDLASQIDLSCTCKVHVRSIDGKLHYFVFPKFYLPEDRIALAENQHYQKWAAENHLIPTEGASLDYSLVREDLVNDVSNCSIQAVCYDERYAGNIMQDLEKLTQCTLVNVPQRTEHLSLPMKALDSAILDGRVHHDGNPVMSWCMANVVAHADKNDNVFPNKSKVEHKIDGAVALINAFNRAITCDALVDDNSVGIMFV